MLGATFGLWFADPAGKKRTLEQGHAVIATPSKTEPGSWGQGGA